MKKKKTKRKTTSRRPASRATGRRNRKLHAEGFRMPATLTLVLVSLFGVGVLYLWVCSRTEALAQEIKTEERTLEQLEQKVSSSAARWSEMTGPRQLKEALARHQLQMDWPRSDQVIHIQDMAMWETTSGDLRALGRLEREQGAVNVP